MGHPVWAITNELVNNRKKEKLIYLGTFYSDISMFFLINNFTTIITSQFVIIENNLLFDI